MPDKKPSTPPTPPISAAKCVCPKCRCEHVSVTFDGKPLGTRAHCLKCGETWDPSPKAEAK